MDPVLDLGKLSDIISHRVGRLSLLTSEIASQEGYGKRVFTSHVVIELDNLLILGLRAFTFGSLLKGHTRSGLYVKTTKHFNSDDSAPLYRLL